MQSSQYIALLLHLFNTTSVRVRYWSANTLWFHNAGNGHIVVKNAPPPWDVRYMTAYLHFDLYVSVIMHGGASWRQLWFISNTWESEVRAFITHFGGQKEKESEREWSNRTNHHMKAKGVSITSRHFGTFLIFSVVHSQPGMAGKVFR